MYSIMYASTIKMKTIQDVVVLNPAWGKVKEEFLAWMQGFMDGVGDNPFLSDEEKESAREEVTTRMKRQYQFWWNSWLLETT